MLQPNAFALLTGFDTAHLQSLYGDDTALAIEMFTEYLREIPKDAADLSYSYRSNNVELFRTYLHKLKPGFTYVGLTGLAQGVADLENRCLGLDSLTAHQSSIELLLHRITDSEALIADAIQRLRSKAGD